MSGAWMMMKPVECGGASERCWSRAMLEPRQQGVQWASAWVAVGSVNSCEQQVVDSGAEQRSAAGGLLIEGSGSGQALERCTPSTEHCSVVVTAACRNPWSCRNKKELIQRARHVGWASHGQLFCLGRDKYCCNDDPPVNQSLSRCPRSDTALDTSMCLSRTEPR